MKHIAVRRRMLPLTFMLFFVCALLLAYTLHTFADTPAATLEGPESLTYGDDLVLTLRGDSALAEKEIVFTLQGQSDPIATVVADGEGVAVLTVAHPANADEGKVTYRIEAGVHTLYATCEGEEAPVASLTVTVLPRKVTLKDFAVSDRVYNGTTSATATHGGLEGVLEGDTVNPVEGVCFFSNIPR